MSERFNRGYVDAKGNSIGYSTYELTQCIMENIDGDIRDIRNMVAYIRISESAACPSLVCEIGIKDESNFLEEFNITGSETLDIEIVVKSLDVERVLEYKFFVQEYDDFARTSADTQSQAYCLFCVSEHAILAPFKPISKPAHGTSTSVIESIFKDHLNVDEFITFGECGTQYTGIININNPLVQVVEILNNCVDINNTPYMLWQDLSAIVKLAPLSYLTDRNINPVYKTFTNTNVETTAPGTQANFAERSRMMSEVSSNIGLAPAVQAKTGAFASDNRYIDIATKSYRRTIFDAAESLDTRFTTSKKEPYYGRYVSNRRESETPSPLNKIPEAMIVYHYVNKNAFSGGTNMADINENNAHISRAYLNNYDACTHQFTVMGDTHLNPGKTIALRFPKATDPKIYKEYTGKTDAELYDLKLSGDYLIFNTTHTFMDGIYATSLVVKTDSLRPETTL